AVSVGEARGAAPRVRALAQALPDHRVLVTCTTAAGRETVKQVYGETVLAAYLPFDFPEPVQRFLEHFRPRLGVLMETEVWPNLLAGCAQNGVPVLLANARMSEKSARGYALWSALTRPAFAVLAAVCAQSAADAERLRALGARDVEVTGNLKFDVHPDAAQVAAGRAWRGAPVVAGPSMFNFADATRLAVEAGAALQASDGGSAIRTALGLIADQSRRRRMGEAGKKLCEAHRGATEKHLKRGLSLIKS